MAPARVDANGNKAQNGTNPNGTDIIKLEKLFIHDADVFQTSLNSEDYLESLAPIITDALKANAFADFIKKLNEIVGEKNDELNEISLSSAHDINTCIDTIDKVSRESKDLSSNMGLVNDFLKKSVLDLIAKKKRLIGSKETVRKIHETTTVLNLCIQVLEITNKIHEWIKQHKYFSALKLTDELSSIHLPKVLDFLFSVKIYDSIPVLTSMIKEESFDGLSKWMSTQIERKIDVIGDAVFINLADLQDNWEQLRSNPDMPMLLPHRLNSPVERSMRSPELNLDIFGSRELNIPLGHVYDCVLVYQSLNELPFLASAYHKEWTKKYQRIIYPITLSLNLNEKLALYSEPTVVFPDLASLAAYLRKVAAFFVLDKQLNTRLKFDLRHNDTANDLWESFSIKLKPVLLHHLHRQKFGAEDLDALADLKDLIGDFLQVMEDSHYKIIDLYEILVTIFKDYFGPNLIKHFRNDFLVSIQTDHYMPLVVTDQEDYDNVMKICWYKSDASFAPKNRKPLPISFPFSEDYVHYCLGIRTLLQDMIDFTSKHYGCDLHEINAIIVNDVIERVLSDEPGVGICNDIKEFIDRNSNNKEIVAQSYTNLEYYLFSLYEIGKLIDRRLRHVNGLGIINIDTNSTLKLQAIELFTNVRKFSENTIFKMVDQKLRELLDMVEYDDWLPGSVNLDPNFFILDFALFLENLFNSIFSNLPTAFRTLGLFRSYDYIAEYFLDILNNTGAFNRIAIQNFDLDIKHLEKSMAKLASIADNEEGGSVALQATFAELRQSIDVLLLENNAEFENKAAFMRRFDRLKYENALKLLLKMHADGEEAETPPLFSGGSTRNASPGLDREGSILSSASFAKWGKNFRKNET